jgi:hypothetical protein
MESSLNRREFVQVTAAGSAACFGLAAVPGLIPGGAGLGLVNSRPLGSKARVARLYMGTSHGLWPKPNMDFPSEIRRYETEFGKLRESTDVDFVVDELVTSAEQAAALGTRLQDVDGILAIHFNIGVGPILREVLGVGKPTVVFAQPYSGHEWVGFGALQREELGAKLECLLTSDYSQLALAIRPFRAIHHLREARILNLTTRPFETYATAMREKFGTEIRRVDRDLVLAAYEAVSDRDARAEATRWVRGAVQVVEPPAEDIYRSSRLALALERLLRDEDATDITIDCYGTMWDGTIQLPAYPCLGFTRLNDMGCGGICESDLASAMTHVLYRGLVGRPGFISDPTVDESNGTIILAHCLGTTKMDGPAGPAAPYKLRTIMERQEGVVPQVEMRVGQKVTQAILVGIDFLPYFTGEIVAAPVGMDVDRGCRTKIVVKVDGDVTSLWKNWSAGLHRQTCYGDITRELRMFCRFTDIRMVNEAV